MQESTSIEGIIPVLSTPLKKNGAVDVKGLTRLVNFLIKKKIGGLWVLGTGSEDMNLSFAKRVQVAKVVTEANRGKVPLIVGASFFAMDDILSFFDEIKNLNFNSYHVMPYHPLLSLDRLNWFYKKLADECPKPLWMYTSANWCRPVPPDFVAALADYPNIAGIKFSSSNSTDVMKVINMSNDLFQVITAIAGQLYQCLCMGVKAHTSSLASCVPEFLIRIYDLFIDGNMGDSLREQKRLIDFLNKFSKGPKQDNFLMAAEEKYLLSLRGICSSYTSSYYRDTSEEEQTRLKELVKQYQLFPLE